MYEVGDDGRGDPWKGRGGGIVKHKPWYELVGNGHREPGGLDLRPRGPRRLQHHSGHDRGLVQRPRMQHGGARRARADPMRGLSAEQWAFFRLGDEIRAAVWMPDVDGLGTLRAGERNYVRRGPCRG